MKHQPEVERSAYYCPSGKEFNLQSVLENDANAAAYGSMFMVRKGKDLVYLTVSTRSAELLSVNSSTGVIIRRRSGHMIILPDGPLCSCGRRVVLKRWLPVPPSPGRPKPFTQEGRAGRAGLLGEITGATGAVDRKEVGRPLQAPPGPFRSGKGLSLFGYCRGEPGEPVEPGDCGDRGRGGRAGTVTFPPGGAGNGGNRLCPYVPGFTGCSRPLGRRSRDQRHGGAGPPKTSGRIGAGYPERPGKGRLFGEHRVRPVSRVPLNRLVLPWPGVPGKTASSPGGGVADHLGHLHYQAKPGVLEDQVFPKPPTFTTPTTQLPTANICDTVMSAHFIVICRSFSFSEAYLQRSGGKLGRFLWFLEIPALTVSRVMTGKTEPAAAT